MPIYEYRCKSCGRTFEVIQKFSDRPLRKCEDCSGTLEKLVSRSAFHLRGGGWFINDYAQGKPSSPSSEKEAKAPGGAADGSPAPDVSARPR